MTRSSYLAAAEVARGGAPTPEIWEQRLVARQRRVRASYLAQSRLLATSPNPEDRALAAALEQFVLSMPAPDSKRFVLARELRAHVTARSRAGRERGIGKDRR